MSSKYVDLTAVVQVIGCVYNNPQLLDYTDKYTISEQDFQDQFHKIAFGAIYKLYELGAKVISLESIGDFLAQRPKSEALFKQQKGEEWLLRAADNASEATFDYYYGRLKKMSLLRAYDNCGIDVSFIYDTDNILDIKKKQVQEETLDNSSLDDIAKLIDNKIDAIRAEYVNDSLADMYQAGEDVEDLIDKFKQFPEVGLPLYGPLINAVTRGARLSKLYLRSAATGTGKTRTMIADACYIACDEIYDNSFGWIKTNVGQPALFIGTEQDKEEIQTMMLAFLSNVNEDHILNGYYIGDEEDRVRHAVEVLKRAPLYVETIPDFCMEDIEDNIKRAIRERDVRYVFN